MMKTTNDVFPLDKERGNYKVLIICILALLSAFFVCNFIISLSRIDGESMAPTLTENDFIVSSRLAYIKSTPARGDIVVFRKPDVASTLIVKRIAAIPGDSVEILDGICLINGKEICTSDGQLEKVTLGDGMYFVIGDNLESSIDSRVWEHPFIISDDIIGKVVFRLFPRSGRI